MSYIKSTQCTFSDEKLSFEKWKNIQNHRKRCSNKRSPYRGKKTNGIKRASSPNNDTAYLYKRTWAMKVNRWGLNSNERSDLSTRLKAIIILSSQMPYKQWKNQHTKGLCSSHKSMPIKHDIVICQTVVLCTFTSMHCVAFTCASL